MSLSISNTNGTLSMLRALYQTSDRLGRTYSHLATGRRIAGASDDAAGLGIAERLRARSIGLFQGERNLADGISYASTAEGRMESSHETLHRMRELAVQAGNGTLSAEDRATIQEEYDQLAATLDQTAPEAESRTFTDGNGGEVTVEVADTTAGGLGVGGLDVADEGTLGAIDAAIDEVSTARSALGTAMNRMAYRSDIAGAMRESTDAARSRIEDADFALELADLTRDRLLYGLQISGLSLTARSQGAVLDLFG